MRIKRIGAVSFLVDDELTTIKKNIERAVNYIEKAASYNIDILLLPEAVLTQNTEEAARSKGGIYPIEVFPGKITKYFCEKAKESKINLLLPNYVYFQRKIYNQTTIINCNGDIVGYYRKIQPTFGEIKYIYAGNDFPIFQLSDIKIATMTCLDIYFPEICRIYAMKGAEIIFWPTLTHGPTQSGLEAQYRSRAIDNSIYLVQSNISCKPPYAPYAGRYQPGRANIIDFYGDIIADTGRREGICFSDIDFDEVKITSGVLGFNDVDETRKEFESIIRMELYSKEYKTISKNQKKSNFYHKKN